MVVKSWLAMSRDIKCMDSCTCKHDCNKYAIKETFYTDTQGKWDTITYCDKCGFLIKNEGV